MTSIISEPISPEENAEGIIAQAEGGEDLKFCSDCKHLLGVRYKTELFENWHCVHPNNLIRNEKKWNLVTGIQEYIREYHEGSLLILRSAEGGCGVEGKWWEEYKAPEYHTKPTIGGVEGKEIEKPFEAADLDNIKAGAAERLAQLKASRAKKLTNQDLTNL